MLLLNQLAYWIMWCMKMVKWLMWLSKNKLYKSVDAGVNLNSPPSACFLSTVLYLLSLPCPAGSSRPKSVIFFLSLHLFHDAKKNKKYLYSLLMVKLNWGVAFWRCLKDIKTQTPPEGDSSITPLICGTGNPSWLTKPREWGFLLLLFSRV